MNVTIHTAEFETLISPARVIEREGAHIRIEPGRVSILAGSTGQRRPTAGGASAGTFGFSPAGRRDN